MRKIGTILVLCLLLVGFAFAGGIVTNGNQSADYFRLMNRNASTDVDAVYFNPAGITFLKDGLNFYLSSQTIYQSRTLTSDVPALKDDTFEGSTFAPVFPNFYVAYKTGNLAIGAGFIPIGGGGSAIFDDGIPSFAVPAAVLFFKYSIFSAIIIYFDLQGWLNFNWLIVFFVFSDTHEILIHIKKFFT